MGVIVLFDYRFLRGLFLKIFSGIKVCFGNYYSSSWGMLLSCDIVWKALESYAFLRDGLKLREDLSGGTLVFYSFEKAT